MMAKIRVEVGETSTHGCVGIQPPLSEAQQASLGHLAFLFQTKEASSGDSYSALAVIGENKSTIAENTISAGRRITDILVEAGFDTEMDETVYSIHGSTLFTETKVVKGPPLTYPLQAPGRTPAIMSSDPGSRAYG